MAAFLDVGADEVFGVGFEEAVDFVEEVVDADLLLHVVDAASPGADTRLDAVNRILEELGFRDMPTVVVLNKADAADPEALDRVVTLAVVAMARKPDDATTVDVAIDDGRVRPGDIVMMSAFAHAGDFAAAGAIRWSGRS